MAEHWDDPEQVLREIRWSIRELRDGVGGSGCHAPTVGSVFGSVQGTIGAMLQPRQKLRQTRSAAVAERLLRARFREARRELEAIEKAGRLWERESRWDDGGYPACDMNRDAFVLRVLRHPLFGRYLRARANIIAMQNRSARVLGTRVPK